MGTIRIKRVITDLLQRAQQLTSPLKNSSLVTPGGWPIKRPCPESPDQAESKELQNEKPRVFISYSRKDIGFIAQLNAALEMRGIDTLID